MITSVTATDVLKHVHTDDLTVSDPSEPDVMIIVFITTLLYYQSINSIHTDTERHIDVWTVCVHLLCVNITIGGNDKILK